jgi:ferredoxin
MADRSRKVTENTPGRFYVDETCIDCDLCRETAPRVFGRQEDAGYSFVAHQPQGPEEEAASVAALEECPVEAIGRDGE